MKNHYLLYIATASAMMMASCSNDSEIQTAIPEAPVTNNGGYINKNIQLTFSAGCGNDKATSKTAIDADNNLDLVFQKDDQIYIQDGNQDISAATAILPEGKTETSPTCTFSATFSDGTIGDYTAFYPMSAYTTTIGELISAGNLNATQEVANGTFDPEAHIMTASTDSKDMDFKFKTQNSFLRFTAPCDLDKVILRGHNGEKIAGNFTIESDGSIKAADGASSEITLDGEMKEGEVFYISLIPTKFTDGLTLYIYNGDKFATYSVDKEVETLANKVKNFKALPSELADLVSYANLDKYLAVPAGETVTICVSDIEGHWTEVKWYIQQFQADVKLVLPDGIETIEYGAFDGCKKLIDVTIPNSVTSIEVYAFNECSGLTSVTIPKSITSIKPLAFEGTNLKEVNYNAKEFEFLSKTLEKVTLGDNVESIGVGAFEECTSLASITIPDNITSIGSSAFSGCTGLTSITIPDNVTSIGSSAFLGCTGLTSITIPDNVTSIEGYTFALCENLSSITIPNSVKSIGENAFQGTGLTNITIPNNVESIGMFAFAYSGFTSITIPSSVTSIGVGAFEGTNLKEVNYNAEEFVNLSSSLEKVTLGANVRKIGDYAFMDCGALESITIPNSVENIGDYAFQNCGALESITIPNSVESIGMYAFQNCTGLSSITIPNSVETIGDLAFEGTSCPIHVTQKVYDWYEGAYGSADGALGRMEIDQ